MSQCFQFKQFTVHQDRCGMKVGTDGVLLGAWAEGGKHILDIGTGTGLIALMLAQRCPEAEITGVELDEQASLQALENVTMSAFAQQVKIENMPIQQFSKQQLLHSHFNAIVSNPPYSTKWAGKNDMALVNDPRFSPAGVLAPSSKADLAFTMHMLHWLAEDGTAAIVEFPGVLYRGGAEGKIRRYLVENNFVHTIIQLPPDLFFGTTIATCIIVLKKSRVDDKVLFVDASSQFVREGNKNRLNEENREHLLSLAFERKDVEHVAKLVSIDDIAANDWNLSVSSYVEPEDTREKVDIAELNNRIAGIVERQQQLRASIDAIVAELEADQLVSIPSAENPREGE